MITIIHGGQTGVDRGAHVAAIDNAWKISGFMPEGGHDELGLIPRDVALFLRPCDKGGYTQRTKQNLAIANALLVVVADVHDPYATPGTKLTLEHARKLELKRMIADPRTETAHVADWLQALINHHVRQLRANEKDRRFRLMVAGPRASKWPQGQSEAAGLLRRVKVALEGKHS